jgi:hypothetical protein
MVIMPQRIRYTGHVACMGEVRSVYKMWVGKPDGNRHLEHLSLGRRIISEWILNMVESC